MIEAGTPCAVCLLRREAWFVSQFAYLVIREGAKWSDVFRLIPGQSVTIGRAPTSQIVLNDERCSRNHVEIFLSSGQWTLRDLESRNGTFVGNQMIRGDWALKPGDIVRIGRTQLLFVHKLSDAFTTSGDAGSVIRRLSPDAQPQHATGVLDEASVLEEAEPTTITHRRGQTKFLVPGRRGADCASRRWAARRRSFAAWRSSWPRPRTWRRWPNWLWRAWPRERRPTPARCCSSPPLRSTSRAARTWKSSPRGARRPTDTIASRTSWPRPCSAKEKRCWPATSSTTAPWARGTARAKSSPPA